MEKITKIITEYRATEIEKEYFVVKYNGRDYNFTDQTKAEAFEVAETLVDMHTGEGYIDVHVKELSMNKYIIESFIAQVIQHMPTASSTFYIDEWTIRDAIEKHGVGWYRIMERPIQYVYQDGDQEFQMQTEMIFHENLWNEFVDIQNKMRNLKLNVDVQDVAKDQADLHNGDQPAEEIH